MAQVLGTCGVDDRGSVSPLKLQARPRTIMEKTAEQVYTDLLRQLASPSAIQPAVLADLFRDVERMHSMGHITDWQLQNAREAYATTIEREPREGGPRSPETRADERG